MSQTELNTAIENAFQLCADKSWELFDAWYDRLHNVVETHHIFHSEIIESEWNESNLNLMLQGIAPVA